MSKSILKYLSEGDNDPDFLDRIIKFATTHKDKPVAAPTTPVTPPAAMAGSIAGGLNALLKPKAKDQLDQLNAGK